MTSRVTEAPTNFCRVTVTVTNLSQASLWRPSPRALKPHGSATSSIMGWWVGCTTTYTRAGPGRAAWSALILKGRPRDLGAIWLRAPPQDVWHRVPRVYLSVTAAMTCNGF